LHRGKRLAIEGLLLGGFGIKPFVYQKKIKEYLCERFDSEIPRATDSLSTFQNLCFGQYPSSPVKLPSEFSIVQGVRVSVKLSDFFCDETSGANIIHPGSLGLGLAQGVSSFLTLNEFKLECGFLFQVTKSVKRKGDLQRTEGFHSDRRT
jgi:hypothetical protein